MSSPITTTLSPAKHEFLIRYSAQIHKPKNYIIERGLELVEREYLAEQIRTGLADRQKEYGDIVETFRVAQIDSIPHDL